MFLNHLGIYYPFTFYQVRQQMFLLDILVFNTIYNEKLLEKDEDDNNPSDNIDKNKFSSMNISLVLTLQKNNSKKFVNL